MTPQRFEQLTGLLKKWPMPYRMILDELLTDNDRLREENERLRRALEGNGIGQAWRDGFLSAADTVASFTTNREFSSYSEVRDTFVDILKRASVGQHEYAKALKDTP